MVVRSVLSLVFASVIAVTVAAIQQGLKIEVIEGQDAAYVAGQGPSTAAIVEVRDAKNAPMPNVLVTFAIMPANTKLASFSNGLMRIGVMTDANGRATAAGLVPLATGPFSIQAAVVADGASPIATLFATNYATAADAIRSRPGASAPNAIAPPAAPPATMPTPAAPPEALAPRPSITPAPAMASADDLGLQIVVIQGEDGVNIIQQKTAVQPIVEVRDKNNVPVAGVLVTFGISGAGGGVSPAAFANGLSRIGVMTDSSGRAAVQGLQALGRGAFNIDISATMNGQTVTKVLGQSNFQTIAEALSAGKTPAVSQGTQATQNASSQGSSQSSNAGSQSSNAGSQASNASSASGSGGGAAGSGAAAGGGGLGGGAIAGITVGTVALGAGAAYQLGYLDALFPVCKSEEDAVINAANSLNYNSLYSCLGNSRSTAQDEACYRQYAGPFNDALGNWCACGANKFGDEERQAFAEYVVLVRELGGNTSSLQRCAS
jgi:hypothetical protein